MNNKSNLTHLFPLVAIAIMIIFVSCSKGEKKVIEKYNDGSDKVVLYFKDKNGKKIKSYQINYYSNGKKRLCGAWNDDKRTGIWQFNYEDGSKFATADFTNKKEGEKWNVWYDKDSIIVNEKDVLQSIAFSPEGTLVSIKVKKSTREVFYRFFDSFRIMEKVSLKGGIPDGEAMSWFENGTINSIHYYKDGFQDSTYTVYAETGQKIISGQYNKGKQIGKWEYFSSNGSPLGMEVYDTDGTKLVERDNQGLKYGTKPAAGEN